jgi:hypothetical protein
MTVRHLCDPGHHLLQLLIPSRSVLLTRSSAGDGHYAFFVEHIVLSKTVVDVLEEDLEVCELPWGSFARHFALRPSKEMEGIVAEEESRGWRV